MYKMYRQALKTLVAAGVIAGILGTTQVNSKALTLDEIYANAYNATINALNIKTQKSINEARQAIETLRGTDAGFAVGEFSKQVDNVQHPFLVDIIHAINKAEESGRQLDINAARAVIDPELPQVWKNSYSQKLDEIQQVLMKELIYTYNLAVDFIPLYMEQFKNTFEEIKLASNSEIVAWAYEFTKPMSTVWSDTYINNIEDKRYRSASNESYDYVRIYNTGSDVTNAVIVDENKTIIALISDWKWPRAQRNAFYSDNQLVYIDNNDFITQDKIYFKDGNLLKWVVIECTNDVYTQRVKVYDESNLPPELKDKLSIYKEYFQQLSEEALNVIK